MKLDRSREAAQSTLTTAAGAGHLSSKAVGENLRIWWQSVEGSPGRDGATTVEIGDEGAVDGWQFCVADDAIGMAPERTNRTCSVFIPLHGDDEYDGMGIGLARCQKVVERHGGVVWVDSEPWDGSAFYSAIAATEDDAEP